MQTWKLQVTTIAFSKPFPKVYVKTDRRAKFMFRIYWGNWKNVRNHQWSIKGDNNLRSKTNEREDSYIVGDADDEDQP